MIRGMLAAALSVVFTCIAAAAAKAGAARSGIAFDWRSPDVWPALSFLALLQAAILWRADSSRELLLAIALAAVGVCAVSDARTGYVFDAVTLPSCAAILLGAAFEGSGGIAVMGSLCAGGCLIFLFLATKGRGIGLGDVKLACSAGAALGAQSALAALGIAFVSGGTYAAVLLFTGRARRGHVMRFAPYLAAGVFAAALVQVS